MPWLRTGDNAATHPIVMGVAALARGDDQAVNEVFGFVLRCALQSAGHLTDYVVDEGTAWMIGGTRTEQLLQLAVKAGYLKRVRRKGRTVWQITDDPEFIHMKLRSEVEWERQQRRDNANPALTVPVRHRDGDACRYCARIVTFAVGARRGANAGTYDHREPGKAGTVDTMVVACGLCNPARRDYPDADERRPLLPVPASPFYSTHTAGFLARHGVHVDPTTRGAGDSPGTASAARGAGDPPGTAPAVSAETPQIQAETVPTQRVGSGRAGTGRAGSGGRRNRQRTRKSNGRSEKG